MGETWLFTNLGREIGENPAGSLKSPTGSIASGRSLYHLPSYQIPSRQLCRRGFFISASGMAGKSLTAQFATACPALRMPGITVDTAGSANTHLIAACGIHTGHAHAAQSQRKNRRSALSQLRRRWFAFIHSEHWRSKNNIFFFRGRLHESVSRSFGG